MERFYILSESIFVSFGYSIITQKHILQEGITIITMNVIHQYSYARIARTNFECNPYFHHYVEPAAMVHAKYFEQKQIVLLQKAI